MKNYSNKVVKILGKEHELEITTSTLEYISDYCDDDSELGKLDIPNDEVAALDKLIASDVLNSDNFHYEVMHYINYERNGIGMDLLEEKDLWQDLSISEISTTKNDNVIQVSLCGNLDETDQDHGISMTFIDCELKRITHDMEYDSPITSNYWDRY